jgi:hypothetical protein
MCLVKHGDIHRDGEVIAMGGELLLPRKEAELLASVGSVEILA